MENPNIEQLDYYYKLIIYHGDGGRVDYVKNLRKIIYSTAIGCLSLYEFYVCRRLERLNRENYTDEERSYEEEILIADEEIVGRLKGFVDSFSENSCRYSIILRNAVEAERSNRKEELKYD